jgi:hypothetical protein
MSDFPNEYLGYVLSRRSRVCQQSSFYNVNGPKVGITMSPPDLLTFTLFLQFPAEVRLEVWRLCLPHRVLELDYPVDDTVVNPTEPPWFRTNHKITNYNTRPPVLARVCQESRQVVLETCSVLALADRDHPAYWTEGWGVYPEPWFDRVRTDFVYLGWTPTRDIEAPHTGDPIRHLLWVAGQTDRGRVSISLDFLLEHSGDAPSHRAIWKRDELADLMRQVPEWTVVIAGSVVVRTDVETAAASGLFGLLADSRVQIVQADDEARMARFLALGGAPGVTLSLSRFNDTDQDSFSPSTVQEAVQNSKAWVSEAVTGLFGSEESAPRFHTGVMFRLCTKIGSTNK